jgi:hypothetical protein
VPATTITLNGEQRDGLYELVRNHLGSVSDLFDALERERVSSKAEDSARSSPPKTSGCSRTSAGARERRVEYAAP